MRQAPEFYKTRTPVWNPEAGGARWWGPHSIHKITALRAPTFPVELIASTLLSMAQQSSSWRCDFKLCIPRVFQLCHLALALGHEVTIPVSPNEQESALSGSAAAARLELLWSGWVLPQPPEEGDAVREPSEEEGDARQRRTAIGD